MKLPIYVPGMFCLALASATSTLAQDSHEPEHVDKTRTPKVVIGGKIGLSHSYDSYQGVADANMESSIFFRHYLGKHLALETGLDHSYGSTVNHRTTWYGGVKPVLKTNVITVPIHLQYHFGKSESAIRPYFGIGMGMQRTFYRETSLDHRNREIVYNNELNGAMLQFTQGLTWQVSKRLQVNQSLYYRYGTFPHVGFQIGAGYTFLR